MTPRTNCMNYIVMKRGRFNKSVYHSEYLLCLLQPVLSVRPHDVTYSTNQQFRSWACMRVLGLLQVQLYTFYMMPGPYHKNEFFRM